MLSHNNDRIFSLAPKHKAIRFDQKKPLNEPLSTVAGGTDCLELCCQLTH